MAKSTRKRAARQVLSAIDRGVNYLDTAMPYHMGGSESFLGRTLTNGLRDKVRIATKLPPWSVKKPSDMDDLLNSQLVRLKTDHIDYYLLHAMEKEKWEKLLELDVLDFLDRAKATGKIVNAGFSFHGDLDCFKTIVDAREWEFCQIQYNYLDRLNQAGLEGLRYAAEKKLGVIVMEPLRGGNLAGRVPDAVGALWDTAKTKRTPAEWGLRWVWNHPEVTVVLSGMNETSQVDENIRIAETAETGSLSTEELNLVDRVETTYRSLMKAGCTGCRYSPCPALRVLDIPSCFEVYNNYHAFGDRQSAALHYMARLYGAMGTEPACVHPFAKNAAKCEKACPQHLPIQDLLEDCGKDIRGKKNEDHGVDHPQVFRLPAVVVDSAGKRKKAVAEALI